MTPPENALVLCVDEKSQIQALDRTAPCLPMLPDDPGADDARLRPPRHDQPVRRLRPGQRLGHRPALPAAPPPGVPAVPQADRHRRPEGLDLHLVLDNYATHKTPAIKDWLLKHPRFHLHFTPTSSSWMNLVERWFAELTNRKLRRSAHRSVTELETDIRKWINEWNKDPEAVRVDQVRRRDPRNPRRLLPTHHRLRTLASLSWPLARRSAAHEHLAASQRRWPGAAYSRPTASSTRSQFWAATLSTLSAVVIRSRAPIRSG